MSKMAVDPDRRLAAAIVLQAVRDAIEGGDPDLAAPARRWLAGEGVDLVESLDIPPERVAAWLERQPALPYEQLPLFDR